jgi:hypothetical protein
MRGPGQDWLDIVQKNGSEEFADSFEGHYPQLRCRYGWLGQALP